MSLLIELDEDVEKQVVREAERRGRKPSELVAEWVSQGLSGSQEISLARLTALASEPTLKKLWDTPEEDEAWRHL